MRKEIRSTACICVFAVGAGLFSAVLGLASGFVSSAVAGETARAITTQSISIGHLIAAVAIVALSISALRLVRDLDAPERRVRVRSDSEDLNGLPKQLRDLSDY